MKKGPKILDAREQWGPYKILEVLPFEEGTKWHKVMYRVLCSECNREYEKCGEAVAAAKRRNSKNCNSCKKYGAVIHKRRSNKLTQGRTCETYDLVGGDFALALIQGRKIEGQSTDPRMVV